MHSYPGYKRRITPGIKLQVQNSGIKFRIENLSKRRIDSCSMSDTIALRTLQGPSWRVLKVRAASLH